MEKVIHPVFALSLIIPIGLLYGRCPINRLSVHIRVHIRVWVRRIPAMGVCQITKQVVPLIEPRIIGGLGSGQVRHVARKVGKVDVPTISQQLIQVCPAGSAHVSRIRQGCWIEDVVGRHERLLQGWCWLNSRCRGL